PDPFPRIKALIEQEGEVIVTTMVARATYSRPMVLRRGLAGSHLAAESLGDETGHDHVGVEHDPHEISRKTSSSVKIPLERARRTPTRRDSATASCQSFRWMARRTYSLAVRPLSRAARSMSRLVLPGRLMVRVSLMRVRIDHTRRRENRKCRDGRGAHYSVLETVLSSRATCSARAVAPIAVNSLCASRS